jgi:hypothetical protein
VAIEPLGVGMTISTSDTCGGVKDIVTTAINAGITMGNSLFQWQFDQEDFWDCNPLQTNFARLFCDIHCVRDAVVRGDRSIIRNLKRATDVTNKNVDRLSEWIVKSARVDAGWLAEKVDYEAAVNAEYFNAIKQKLGIESAGSSLIKVKTSMEKMTRELDALAQSASFGEVSKLTARDALDKFTKSSVSLAPDPNISNAFEALYQLEGLHGKMAAAAGKKSKVDMVGLRVARSVAILQRQASAHSHTLGIYKYHSAVSKNWVSKLASLEQPSSKTWLSSLLEGLGLQARTERHLSLVALDRIWWQLREQLDRYLDVSQDEIEAFQKALERMSQYEDCEIGYESMISSYSKTMALADRSSDALRDTWHKATNLFGELSAVIVDGDVFNTFFLQEGCSSQLADQTLQMAHTAINQVSMLLYRYKVSGSRIPDAASFKESIKRLDDSFKYAKEAQGCTGN